MEPKNAAANHADRADQNVNLWDTPTHALGYLARADRIHRSEGDRTLLECLPPSIGRVLDLGSGDGRLLALVRQARPGIEAVAIDFSETMLGRLRERFADDARVSVVPHDLSEPLPAATSLGGRFDAIVSSFAIHHLTHPRKRDLYAEVYDLLSPGGVFLNLEHVSSPTTALHHQFLATVNVAPEDEDPSNKLLDVETQLGWMRTIGFADVDCLWKWRELALLAATRAATGS
jgi:tRNA (cmo5U34)-methyltransferase